MIAQKKSSRAVCFPVSFCMPNSRPLVDSGGSRRQHIRALGKKIGNNHDKQENGPENPFSGPLDF